MTELNGASSKRKNALGLLEFKLNSPLFEFAEVFDTFLCDFDHSTRKLTVKSQSTGNVQWSKELTNAW